MIYGYNGNVSHIMGIRIMGIQIAMNGLMTNPSLWGNNAYSRRGTSGSSIHQ